MANVRIMDYTHDCVSSLACTTVIGGEKTLRTVLLGRQVGYATAAHYHRVWRRHEPEV